MWELNFFVALGMAQLAVPHMRAQHGGTIVNLGSIAGKFTLPWLPLYSASKSALGSWTESLRHPGTGRGFSFYPDDSN